MAKGEQQRLIGEPSRAETEAAPPVGEGGIDPQLADTDRDQRSRDQRSRELAEATDGERQTQQADDDQWAPGKPPVMGGEEQIEQVRVPEIEAEVRRRGR